MPGHLVSRDEALDGCRRILDGAFDDCPEQALYMVGTIEEAHQKWQALKGEQQGDDDET